ncbi:hypothetical protein [Bacillus thuringiensis]|nr:hypothetical protein [Bacillus thuringiensis]MBD8071696.1 hypothetical protein [Bacillus thuringiensis]
MMEYLLSLLQNLLKVFLGIIVIGYGNMLVNNISKTQKNLPTPSEAKGKF